ncbi:MAG TPA: TolC family protein [Kiritimatiellia bacterium]|nr:TolC family protein [Kiritimatiellia bacterium]HMP33116.1 TolC family protein [Kiritimatiellia bacterium]
MVRFLILACVWLASWRASATNGVISLETAINTALSGNRELAALELELNGRVLAAEQARYQFAFNLRPIAAASARSDADFLQAGLAGSRQFPAGTEVEAGVRMDSVSADGAARERSGVVFAEVVQPLFRDLGTLVNREGIVAADQRILAARRVLELRKTDLVVQLVEASQDLLRLERLIGYETRIMERYEQLARLTRAREKQGRATRVERLRVEFLQGQAEARRASAIEQRISRQADFAELLGLLPETPLTPEDTPDMRLAVPERDEAVALALANRLDVAQALQDIADARRGMAIATKRLQPGISVVGRYERFGRGTSTDEAWALDEDGWTIGLSTDSDLLLREERLGVRQAALNEQSAALRLEEVEALVRRQVEQALSALRRAEEERRIAEGNLDLATQRANLAQRLFEKGRIDHTAATDAETELLDAQTKLLDARAEAVVAGYRFLRMMGLLLDVPEELKPPAARAALQP